MSNLVATTTAWGDGDTLDVVMERIHANDPSIAIVELSIGARPVAGPSDLLKRWSDRFTFIAHHTAPVGEGKSIIPSLEFSPHTAAKVLNQAGITRYSGHPPGRKFTDTDGMWQWAQKWYEILAENGISWSVETMYVPRTRSEGEISGGYHLSNPNEVWEFCDRASSIGWDDPLLIDVSHLFIGLCGGQWTAEDVVEVLQFAPSRELHVSMNDGRRDIHRPAEPDDIVFDWVQPYLDRFEYVVDEGRRRGRYQQSHILL